MGGGFVRCARDFMRLLGGAPPFAFSSFVFFPSLVGKNCSRRFPLLIESSESSLFHHFFWLPSGFHKAGHEHPQTDLIRRTRSHMASLLTDMMHPTNISRYIPVLLAFVIALAVSLQPHHAATAFSLPTATTTTIHSRRSPTQLRAESETQAERQPWDAFRFIRQSSRFIRPPNPFRATGAARVVQPGDVIWSAGDTAVIEPKMTWAPLDDVVMGGVSSSEFDNNTGMWVGTVSSTNNGGFVGIRTTPFDPPLDMTGCKGIELRLRGGDAKRFKAVVRDSADFNGVCWTSSFDAPRNRSGGAVRLPFDKQVPTIFANTVEGKSFMANNVVGFQLAYSKFEYDGGLNPKFVLGDFSLQLVEVKAY